MYVYACNRKPEKERSLKRGDKYQAREKKRKTHPIDISHEVLSYWLHWWRLGDRFWWEVVPRGIAAEIAVRRVAYYWRGLTVI